MVNAMKYNFSKQIDNETYQVTGADSFDEARKAVEKAIYQDNLNKAEALKAALKAASARAEDWANLHPPVVPGALTP